MFCPKCGTQAIDGAEFCQKCGAKLIVDTSVSQPAGVQTSTGQTQLPSKSPVETPKKKKSKKLLIGIVAAAVIAVVAITIVLSGGSGGDEPTLFQLAEDVSPMTEFGFDATYGDVFHWLMADSAIKLEQDGDVAYLTFSGKVTGGDYPVSIVLKMTGLSSNAATQRLEPYAMTLNGIEVPDFNNPQGALMELFWAHKNRSDYETFMDFVEWDNENGFGVFQAYMDGNSLPAVQQPSGDIGKALTYDNAFGNIEVTLDDAQFVEYLADDLYPDEGCVFLRVFVTVENIGKETGGLPFGLNKLVYDDQYEFEQYWYAAEEDISNIRPLSPPKQGTLTFMIPHIAAESNKSLVLNVGDGFGNTAISYVLRPDGGTISNNQAAFTQETVDSMNEAQRIAEAWLIDHPIGDGMAEFRTGAPANDVESISAEYFVLELWEDQSEFTGLVYVRKSDGYMTFHSKSSEEYDLDEWYAAWSGNAAASDLSYQGISLTGLLGCAPVQIYNSLGAPTHGTPVDGDMYLGGEYYGYDGINFIIDYATSKVGWITGAAEAVEFNGITLDKTRAELIDTLGTPAEEENIYDEMEDISYYMMQYILNGTVVDIVMEDSTSTAHTITISQAND